MTRRLILILLLLALPSCATYDTNKALYVASTAALIVDWGQTRYGVTNGYRERNFFLGAQPTLDEVDRYFAGWVIGNTALYFILPDEWQKYWYGGILGLELVVIGQNRAKGVKFNWGM